MMIFGSKGLQTKCEEVVNDKIVQQEFRTKFMLKFMLEILQTCSAKKL
jgi:hypothetical protein